MWLMTTHPHSGVRAINFCSGSHICALREFSATHPYSSIFLVIRQLQGRLGIRSEGRELESLFLGGKWHDKLLFGLLAHDYHAAQKKELLISSPQ